MSSLGIDDPYVNWSYLDPVSFAMLAMILTSTEICLVRQQGLFRLVEALEILADFQRTQVLAIRPEQRQVYKDTAGDLLVAVLLHRFLDPEDDPLCRRWFGLILVELLEAPGNQARCQSMPESFFGGTRKVIVESMERTLKIVAGKIIQVAVEGSSDMRAPRATISDFELETVPSQPRFGIDFPYGNSPRWEYSFSRYLVELEEQRHRAKLRLVLL